MKIFILEDNAARVSWFMDKLNQHNLTVSSDAKEALDLVKKHAYDLICLDHDLSDKHYEALARGEFDVEGTGYEVAKAIAGSLNKDKKILVHSWNTVGAKNIKAVLPQAIVCPFGLAEFENILNKLVEGGDSESA